ncbi:unnamed protein product [Periconia digitata]|uniref:Uncharacterized protein n=1 Tax=Periconia digitata TaxID=1303443 RepID=A0A9W4XDX1_9PLEO|nr:unnamed protein product [Periconia digitata]
MESSLKRKWGFNDCADRLVHDHRGRPLVIGYKFYVREDIGRFSQSIMVYDEDTQAAMKKADIDYKHSSDSAWGSNLNKGGSFEDWENSFKVAWNMKRYRIANPSFVIGEDSSVKIEGQPSLDLDESETSTVQAQSTIGTGVNQQQAARDDTARSLQKLKHDIEEWQKLDEEAKEREGVMQRRKEEIEKIKQKLEEDKTYVADIRKRQEQIEQRIH